jgi:transcriptional regulator with PAS, ATPase and Fis domain
MSCWKQGKRYRQVEEQVLREALEHFEGNKTQTAKELGISVRSLRLKCHEYESLSKYVYESNQKKRASK